MNFNQNLYDTKNCGVIYTHILILVSFISVINQLEAQIFLFYNTFISCLYMVRAHMLFIRRSKLHYTASGIITPIGGRFLHETATYRCGWLGWYPCGRLKPATRIPPQPARTKRQHTSKKEHTTNVLIQLKSRRPLMMDVLMSETCRA